MLKSFGSDPEFMLVDPDGKYVSAIGIVPGTKKDKVNLGNGHYAFYDNVLVEVNIKPSANCNETIKNFKDCFKKLAKLVGKYKVVPQAAQVYPEEECQHRDAREFGCDPEFCLYVVDFKGKFEKLPTPICRPGNYLRTGGGHVHVGSDLALPYGRGKPVHTLKMLELFLGSVSVLIDHDPTSLNRKRLYGGAGNHRWCMKYGVEYRTLSNFWLASPKLVEIIYALTDLAIKMVDKNKADDLWSKINANELRTSINTSDKDKIKKNIYPIVASEMDNNLLNEVESMFYPIEFDFYKEWNIK